MEFMHEIPTSFCIIEGVQIIFAILAPIVLVVLECRCVEEYEKNFGH